METKEIHYYKDNIGMYYSVIDEPIIHETHMAANAAIQTGVNEIHTYALSTLDFSYLLDLKYDIYLHENGRTMLVTDGTVYGNGAYIKRGHNVMKMWIAGAFNDEFYK